MDNKYDASIDIAFRRHVMRISKSRVPYLAVLLITTFVLAFTGCASPAILPDVTSEPEKPTPVPSVTSEPEKPLQTSTASTPTSHTVKLSLSEPKAVGEVADLHFSVEPNSVYREPVSQMWLEFIRFDPQTYYPLGKRKNPTKSLVPANFDPQNPRHVFIQEAATKRQSTNIAAETVISQGKSSWEGAVSKPGEEAVLSTKVSFPEPGEWRIIGWFSSASKETLGWIDLLVTVTENSAHLGWQGDEAKGARWQSPNETRPISVTLKPSKAPLVGEPLDLTVACTSIRDLEQAEIFVSVSLGNDGPGKTRIPLEDVLVGGSLTWQGSMKRGETVVLTGTLVFPKEGDWVIGGWGRATPESTAGNVDNVFLNVGKEYSRYGWNDSHLGERVLPKP
jgi:hypothetical protein